MNPSEVSAQLAGLSRELGDATAHLAVADEAAVRLRAAYDVAYARSWLKSEGPVEARKQLAVMQTAQERLDADLATATVRGIQANIRQLGTRIDVGRSLNAAIRAEYVSNQGV